MKKHGSEKGVRNLFFATGAPSVEGKGLLCPSNPSVIPF